MTEEEWVVACVAPFGVSPHPNFREETISPSQKLALVADSRWNDLRRYSKVAYDADWQETLVESAEKSRFVETQADAVVALESLLERDEVDVGARVAACLFAATALADLGRAEQAEALLTRTLEQVNAAAIELDGTRIMLRVVLQQNRVLRAFEQGARARASEMARNVTLNTRNAEQFTFQPFNVSKGLGWNSDRLCVDVIESIFEHALSVSVRDEPATGKLWMELIRSRPKWLDVRIERKLSRTLDAVVRDRFESAFESSKTQRHTVGVNPITEPVEAALFLAEVSGDVDEVRSRRNLLGQLRMSDPVQSSTDSHWSLSEGLKLLRQVDNAEAVNTVLRSLRTEGPLEVLVSAATNLLDELERRGSANRSELSILAAASDLLQTEQNDRSVRIALAYVTQQDDPGLGASRFLPWARVDHAWRILAQIVASSGLHDLIAAEALAVVQQFTSESEPTLARISSALAAINWTNVSDGHQSSWIEWARQNSLASHEVSALAQVVFEELGDQIEVGLREPASTGLRAATRVLMKKSRSVEVEQDELQEASRITNAALQQVVTGSRSGSYSFGGINAADLAAALIIEFDRIELWPGLTELFVEETVNAWDKGPALERLARSRPALPPDVRRQLAGNLDSITRSTVSDPFGEPGLPSLPSGVRFAAAYRLVTFEKAAGLVAELAGMRMPRGRAEAAQAVPYLDSIADDSRWSEAIVLQLSYDEDASVRAEAARAIGNLLGRSPTLVPITRDRFIQLLESDGLLIPLRALQGLREGHDGSNLAVHDLGPALQRLAESRSRSVRASADDILETLPAG